MEKIDVKNLIFGGMGASLKQTLSEDISHFDFPEEMSAQIVTGKLKFTRLEETILLQAELKSSVEIMCDRCLESFVKDVEFSFDREYEIDRKVTSEENLFVDKHFKLDVAEPIREELILAIPLQNVCRDKCKGLCLGCGQNLNEKDCKCSVN